VLVNEVTSQRRNQVWRDTRNYWKMARIEWGFIVNYYSVPLICL